MKKIGKNLLAEVFLRSGDSETILLVPNLILSRKITEIKAQYMP